MVSVKADDMKTPCTMRKAVKVPISGMPASSTGWTFEVALAVGGNMIIARGTNDAGIAHSDTVTVTRLSNVTAELQEGVMKKMLGGAGAKPAK